jgi:hypothetical protein
MKAGRGSEIVTGNESKIAKELQETGIDGGIEALIARDRMILDLKSGTPVRGASRD